MAVLKLAPSPDEAILKVDDLRVQFLTSEGVVRAVLGDLREGYISEAHARAHYPHAMVDKAAE